MAFTFTSERQKKFETLLKRYPTRRAALLPGLWLVQEQEGWVSPEAMEYIARLLDLQPSQVYEVATFYTMFHLKPIGRHNIQVCNSVCCQLRGSEETVAYLKRKLGIEVGESTPDGCLHLSTVECLGSCGTAPMMQIGNDYYEDLSEEKIEKILESLK